MKTELKKHIVSIIKGSSNLTDLEENAFMSNLSDVSKELLFSSYGQVPQEPEGMQPFLNKFGQGQVWEYLWSKVCFLLLNNFNLLHEDFLRLKSIEEQGHFWHSHDAFNAICRYYTKSQDQEVLTYLRQRLDCEDSWEAISYLIAVSIIKDNPTIDEIFETFISKQKYSQQGFLRLFYAFRAWYKSNQQLVSKSSGELFYIAKFDTLAIHIDTHGKEIEEMRFEKQLRAYALNLYLLICKKDEDANLYMSDWIVEEKDDSITEILKSGVVE